MKELNKIAKQNRITAYSNALRAKMASRIIDVAKPGFADLLTAAGKPMKSLNGEILLRKHIGEDGKLKGIISIGVDTLASILPDLKADTDDKAGWAKNVANLKVEGIDILEGIADPQSDEYELTAEEELPLINIDSISDFEAKQKLKDLQNSLRAG